MNNYYPQDPLQYPDDTVEAQSLLGDQLDTYAAIGPDHWYESEQQSSAPPPKASTKTRQRSSGQDSVKHRRTRSGCYTCRERRVKVNHPQQAFYEILLSQVLLV